MEKREIEIIKGKEVLVVTNITESEERQEITKEELQEMITKGQAHIDKLKDDLQRFTK